MSQSTPNISQKLILLNFLFVAKSIKAGFVFHYLIIPIMSYRADHYPVLEIHSSCFTLLIYLFVCSFSGTFYPLQRNSAEYLHKRAKSHPVFLVCLCPFFSKRTLSTLITLNARIILTAHSVYIHLLIVFEVQHHEAINHFASVLSFFTTKENYTSLEMKTCTYPSEVFLLY